MNLEALKAALVQSQKFVLDLLKVRFEYLHPGKGRSIPKSLWGESFIENGTASLEGRQRGGNRRGSWRVDLFEEVADDAHHGTLFNDGRSSWSYNAMCSQVLESEGSSKGRQSAWKKVILKPRKTLLFHVYSIQYSLCLAKKNILRIWTHGFPPLPLSSTNGKDFSFFLFFSRIDDWCALIKLLSATFLTK